MFVRRTLRRIRRADRRIGSDAAWRRRRGRLCRLALELKVRLGVEGWRNEEWGLTLGIGAALKLSRVKMALERDRMYRRVSARPLNATNIQPRLSITPPPTDGNASNGHEASRNSEARSPFPLRLYHRLTARLRSVPPSTTSQPSQAQSPFLRLPGELRNTIYQYLLANNTFHIAVNERAKKLGHVKCTWWSAPMYKGCIFKKSSFEDRGPFYVRMCLDGKINGAGMWNSTQRSGGDVMSLLLTCKAM